jgi:Trk-type K+ transport system membrane component
MEKSEASSNENIVEGKVVKVVLPNSQGILILGIFSLITTFCCGGIGFVGLVLGIIAVVMSSKAEQMYKENPAAYTEGSYKNVNAGRICGIIGIVVNGILIIAGIIYLLVIGAGLTAFFSTFPWENVIN